MRLTDRPPDGILPTMAEDEKPAAEGQPAVAAEPEPPAPAPTPAAAPTEPAAGKPTTEQTIGVPLAAFVRFGTTSSQHDKFVAEQEADAERRRDEDAREKRLAREHGIVRGNPGDVASRYSFQFTDHPEIAKAAVPLTYLTRTGRETTHVGRGDITMPQDPAFPNELALIVHCPRCHDDMGLPAGQAIITIRQSNRPWHLDKRGAGELIVDQWGSFRSAGTVRDGERFTCGRCSWRARVDDNKVWPD